MQFIRVLGYSRSLIVNNKFSKDEVKLILGSKFAKNDSKEISIIENTFDLADLTVADLMSPYEDLVSFDINLTIGELLSLIHKKKYSRYPVYDLKKDNIIGIIHVKDILNLMSQEYELSSVKVSKARREIISVEDSISIFEMLKIFNNGLSHFAIVKNEVRQIVGYVTLDNIISALIGDVRDEYHQVKFPWIKLHDNAYLFKGNTALYHLEKALNLDLNVENVSTISGLITHRIERIPLEKDQIQFDDFSIVIKKMKGPYILLVKVIPKTEISLS